MKDEKDNYVIIDTNVYLEDPSIIKKIKKTILVPVAIIKELDTFKKDDFTRGLNARETIRIFDKCVDKDLKDRNIKFIPKSEYDSSLPVDDIIIEIAKKYKAKIITNDCNVRVSARCENIISEPYKSDMLGKMKPLDEYKGFYKVMKDPLVEPPKRSYPNNSYLVYQSPKGNDLKVYKIIDKKWELLDYKTYKNIEGISARNPYQKMAMDALMDPKIQLISLKGPAGTGKTLITLACGIHQCRLHNKGKNSYNSVSVGRATIPLGRDIGFLPGEIEDKLRPFLAPIYDNLDVLAENNKDPFNKEYTKKLMDENQKMIDIQALSFLRGRSISKKFLIIDEAQNLTLHEANTILTRAGEGTKIILLGDPNQIDHPDLDMYNNGLTYITEAFYGQPFFTSITMEKVERSSLAALAVKILNLKK